eukprot:gene39934-9341_t
MGFGPPTPTCFMLHIGALSMGEDPRTIDRPPEEFHYVQALETGMSPTSLYTYGNMGEGTRFGMSDYKGHIIKSTCGWGPCYDWDETTSTGTNPQGSHGYPGMNQPNRCGGLNN